MSQLQSVLWSKGAFLQPQHLQSQDLYLDSQLKFLMDSMIGYPYGFNTLTIDAARLAGGYFGVKEASGFFPDGLPFDFPGSDPEPEQRSLEGAFGEGQPALTVLLAVPEYHPGQKNVSFEPGTNNSTRFTAGLLNLRDETSGLNEKPVQIAHKNLRFLFPKDDPSGYSVLPVARVARKGDRYELDRAFVPPVLRVSASNYLVSILRALAGVLSVKSQEQAQNRRGSGQGIVDVTTGAEASSFWLHYTVNQHYPAIRNLLNHPHLHPQEQFAEMLALAGALTAFTLKVDPNNLPFYDHDDLGKCFTELDGLLRDLLETAIPRFFVSLPLRLTEQACLYSVFVPEDRFFAECRAVYLAVKSELHPEQQVNADSLKVASSDQMQRILNTAITGVTLTRVQQIPNVIRMRHGYQYFQLETNGDYWRGVVNSRNLSVYASVVAQPIMELIILLNSRI